MKVYLDTVGCRLNQGEMEALAREFRAAGYEIAASADEAQAAVVNTCAVTSRAAADSRSVLRKIARAGVREITATGCWATLEADAAASLPGVRHVVPNSRKDTLVADLFGAPAAAYELEPIARRPLPGLHRRTRAFIKVQDGCDNRCTFCVTTLARGAGRSRAIPDVVADIQAAVCGETREVVLTGVHLGSWGRDFGLRLEDLIRAVLKETDLPRLRLSSLEPWDLDEGFFRLWDDPRLMPHLHLPLQSGCEATLRRMARKTTPAGFRRLMRAARAAIAGVSITTDVIVGFPGETEAEFRESMDFLSQMEFSGGHVFTYSPRPGTAAARMGGGVPLGQGRARNRWARRLLDESAQVHRQRFVGARLRVLWEAVSELGGSGWRMEGWSGNYLRVSAVAAAPRWNEVDQVEIQASDAGGLRGVILDSG